MTEEMVNISIKDKLLFFIVGPPTHRTVRTPPGLGYIHIQITNDHKNETMKLLLRKCINSFKPNPHIHSFPTESIQSID